ncbi:outer membrane receptor for ferrienterochelin and colicin [Alteromonadaceae bacterium 2753L.S.0a.02]|nr:outer membrane receptor for ferrienterochelin and colicin [Alteromonadaceae bacterium 2753L.S.0a.02]
MIDNKTYKSIGLLLMLQIAGSANADTNIFNLTLEQLLSVEVTSTSFVEETLLETSYSVSQVNAQEWRGLAVRNVGDLLNTLPSTIAPISLGQSRLIAIRGYLSTEPNTGTAVRLDGVPINKIREGGGQMALDGFDLSLLQSVELIRGPGSALHGNDAFHGVLSLEMLQAKQTQVRGHAELGTLDDAAVALQGNVVNGAHAVTLGAAQRSIGDMRQAYRYPDSATGEAQTGYRKNARESSNLLFKYRYEPGALSLETTVFLLDFKAQQLPGVGLTDFGNQGASDHSDYHDKMQFLKLGGTHRPHKNRRLELFSYYWQYQDEYHIDLTNLALLGYDYKTWREESHWGLQFHDTLTFAKHSDFTWGYEYKSDRLDDISQWENPPASNNRGVAGAGYHRDLHSFLVDGHQQLNGSGLQLAYGVRWDNYNDFDQQLTPRVALSQAFAQRHRLHVSYGEGFRAPSVYEIKGNAQVRENPQLKPEKLQSLDLKYSYEGPRLVHLLTAFRNRWQEAIQPVRAADNDNFSVRFENAGESSSWGLEYEVRGHWRNLQTEFYISYIRDKGDEEPRYYIPFPHWLAGLQLGYQFTSDLILYCNNRYAYLPEVSHDGLRAMAGDNYMRTDVVLNWEIGTAWDLDFVVRNIFDREQSYYRLERQVDGYRDESQNFSVRLRYAF